MALRCAIPGCGDAAVTLYRGYALCDACYDLAIALPTGTAPVEMEDAIGDCNELEDVSPGFVGGGARCIHPADVLVRRRGLGPGRAMRALYDLAEARGFLRPSLRDGAGAP